MTKGGSGKPKTLGRLIFGEKRKQHASPARHRSSTRNGGSVADLSSSGVGGAGNKNPINLHDWAVWRMQLNEQMGTAMSDRRADLKQMRHYLQSNAFYQQHSRDPSNGRYAGVRLLFSIPHAKFKSEALDSTRGAINKSGNIEVGDTATFEQSSVRPNSDDRTTTSLNSASAAPPLVVDKAISHLIPRPIGGHTGGFLHINEQMVAADTARSRRTVRSSYTASDRVHSTLQKAVKDGNVLEKIKAFEMQAAAAAQAETTAKLGGGLATLPHNRIQSNQSTAQRGLSPAVASLVQQPLSPVPLQNQQQPIRTSRGRYIHPTQQRRSGVPVAIAGHESRKGAHVLEPAHGDIILKRRTPSQKTVNDEDYSMTGISSVAISASQGHPRQHPRSSVSRSRHRQEMAHDKRTPVHHENATLKHQSKQKISTTTTTTTPVPKSNTRRRWLKGRKETPTETPVEESKQETKSSKSNKTSKNKKKHTEEENVEPIKKSGGILSKGKSSSADNNRVYGVPNTNSNEPTKLESTSSQPPANIQEESESDGENAAEKSEKKIPREDDISQSKECETVVHATELPVERRSTKKHPSHQKLSSTDGEILSKVDDETRFSRPTDDHAHRSEINDDDDEGKSEEDVFMDDPMVKPATAIVRHQSVLEVPADEVHRFQQQSNTIRRRSSQLSAEDSTPDRRWQWSKESGGLIDTGSRKKKQQQQQQPPITIITRKSTLNREEVHNIGEEDEEQLVYEPPHSEQIQSPVSNTHTLKKKRPVHTITPDAGAGTTNNKQISKQILHAIMNSMNTNKEIPTSTDEFFENGPHSNPEETITNITAPA